MRYLFELGRVTSLSRAEVEQTLLQLKINFTILNLSQHFLFIETKEPLDESYLIGRLGGVVRIAVHVRETSQIAEDSAEILLQNQPRGKIQFSIHAEHDRRLAEEVKALLQEQGRSARYVPPRNSATIIHNKLIEKQGDLTVIDRDLYVTRAVQPIEAWSERDFGRPGRDSESGMLPPKLARMMINISGASTSAVLLDPFCGSGTVLTEALLMGFTQVIGSDVSEQAVRDTKKNVEWVSGSVTPPNLLRFADANLGAITKSSFIADLGSQTRFSSGKASPLKRGGSGVPSPLPPPRPMAREGEIGSLPTGEEGGARGKADIFQSDVRELPMHLEKNSVDVIVAEPYLGKPLTGQEREDFLREQARELRALYISAFEAFQKIVKPEAVIVFIIPRFWYRGTWIRVECPDEIKRLGFEIIPLTHHEPYILYHRAKQFVGREVWKFVRRSK